MTTPPETDPRLHGVWKLVSWIRRGEPMKRVPTYRVFEGEATWEILPQRIDADEPPFTPDRFATDPAASPARLTFWETEWGEGPGSFGSPPLRAVYAVDGDRLTIAWASDRTFPASLTDEEVCDVELFEREVDAGILIRYRAHAARFERTHPELGMLEWSRHQEWWSGTVVWAGTPRVILDLCAPRDVADEVFDRAADTLRAIDARAVFAFAAGALLDGRDESARRSTDELNVEQIIAKVSPRGLTLRKDGSIEILLGADGLLDGQVVFVTLDATLTPMRADLFGRAHKAPPGLS